MGYPALYRVDAHLMLWKEQMEASSFSTACWIFLPSCSPGTINSAFPKQEHQRLLTCPFPADLLLISSHTPTLSATHLTGKFLCYSPHSKERTATLPSLPPPLSSAAKSFPFISIFFLAIILKQSTIVGKIWFLEQERPRFKSWVYYIWVSLSKLLTSLNLSF